VRERERERERERGCVNEYVCERVCLCACVCACVYEGYKMWKICVDDNVQVAWMRCVRERERVRHAHSDRVCGCAHTATGRGCVVEYSMERVCVSVCVSVCTRAIRCSQFA